MENFKNTKIIIEIMYILCIFDIILIIHICFVLESVDIIGILYVN